MSSSDSKDKRDTQRERESFSLFKLSWFVSIEIFVNEPLLGMKLLRNKFSYILILCVREPYSDKLYPNWKLVHVIKLGAKYVEHCPLVLKRWQRLTASAILILIVQNV